MPFITVHTREKGGCRKVKEVPYLVNNSVKKTIGPLTGNIDQGRAMHDAAVAVLRGGAETLLKPYC